MYVKTLFKAHGLGNDYLVAEDGVVDAGLVRALCDRNRGVGGDGVLEPLVAANASIGVRIWNPDGSVAEKSGNGLRIFAWWAHNHRGFGPSIAVAVGAEVVQCAVDGGQVRVAMGFATFAPSEVPVDRERIDAPIDAGDGPADALRSVAVGVGNPHCVVFRDEPDLDALPWKRWGARLERHPAFPNRTNVQFARVAGPSALELRVWERGAGPTLASGSSACAAAAAAVRTRRLSPGQITVTMPGGALLVTVSPDYALEQRGPVAPVGRFALDRAWRRA